MKTEIKKLLEVRKKIKSKKPVFVQQDYHKKKRLSKKWKRPTGLQSKMRHQFKGYRRRVKQGWRSPVEVRGYHGKGLEFVIINNVSELNKVKDKAIILSSTLGLRKKIQILEKAKELGLTVINNDIEKTSKKLELLKKKKSEEKKEKAEKKKKTLEESVKKAEKKKESAEKETEEEKKELEKKEKDEVLIHKS
ncbi:MAG: 50S ribosomal protein L32e [Candidatus Woesearchaeota archaeon]